jgi:hypothetical protein
MQDAERPAGGAIGDDASRGRVPRPADLADMTVIGATAPADDRQVG